MFFNELSQTSKFQCRVPKLSLDEDPEFEFSDDEVKDAELEACEKDPELYPIPIDANPDPVLEAFPGEHDVIAAIQLVEEKGCTLWTCFDQYMTCLDLKQKQCSNIPTLQRPNTITLQHSITPPLALPCRSLCTCVCFFVSTYHS